MYEYTTEKKLFDKVKAIAYNESEANDLLKDLQKNADYYLSIISPDSYKWTKEENAIQKSFEALALFNVKQQHPMTLSLIRAYQEDKITLKMLRQAIDRIEYFHYVFNAITSQRSSGSISTYYSRYAIKLSKAKTHDKIQSIIREMSNGLDDKIPSFSEFSASFQDLAYLSRRTKSKNIIKYALGKAMGLSSNGLSIDYASMTIEHILPEDGARRGLIEDSIVANIGNLILVDPETNSEELTNLSFTDKKKALLEKDYPFDDFLKGQTEWGEKQIKKRSEMLAKISYKE